jgi:hypothetical protein
LSFCRRYIPGRSAERQATREIERTHSFKERIAGGDEVSNVFVQAEEMPFTSAFG